MGRLADFLNEFEVQLAEKLRSVIFSENGVRLADADEICSFAAPFILPRSADYLKSVGTPVNQPEVYIIGFKNGKPVEEEWTKSELTGQLEVVCRWLAAQAEEITAIADEEGFRPPAAIKTVAAAGSDYTLTKYEFEPLPRSHSSSMSDADAAIMDWVEEIVKKGSACRTLERAVKQQE